MWIKMEGTLFESKMSGIIIAAIGDDEITIIITNIATICNA